MYIIYDKGWETNTHSNEKVLYKYKYIYIYYINNLLISCNYPLVHIAHTIQRDGGKIASDVSKNNVKGERATECIRGSIEVILNYISSRY